MPNAKIIAIANMRRYVGCSTTCYALAAAKAKMGNMVLMIDLNPQSRLTEKCGLYSQYKKNRKYNSSQLFKESTNLLECCFNISLDKLFIIPAVLELELINDFSKQKINIFKKNIYSLQRFFDYIFICCPAQSGLLLYAPLSFADDVLIPIKIEPYVNFDFIENYFYGEIKNANLRHAHTGIIFTNYNVKSHMQTMYLNNYIKRSKNVVCITPTSSVIEKSESLHQPCVVVHPSAAISKVYLALAKTF